MRWLGEKPFHTLLLLTERPAQWAAWQLLPVPVALAAVAGLLWARTSGVALIGWGVALSLLAFALADWAFLAALPRWGVSFGAVQPPWLALVLLRWLLALATLPLAARWPFPVSISLVLAQLFLSLAAAYGTLVEPFRLQVTRLEILTDRLRNPGPPVRIVQLSDLHVERLTQRERALPALVADLEPDLIVLTGDFLSTSYHDDPAAMADLATLLRQLSAPGGIYAVWGTAEVDLPHLLRPVLEELGIVILEDQALEVAIHGHRLWMMGLLCRQELVADGASLRALLAAAPPEALSLLLYHTPDLMPLAAALGVDLYLAGHTHGGQWRLPGFGAILTSSKFWKRYEGGAYRQGTTHLYVSRGIGLEGFGAPRARFFCPPEVVLVELAGTGKERGGAL